MSPSGQVSPSGVQSLCIETDTTVDEYVNGRVEGQSYIHEQRVGPCSTHTPNFTERLLVEISPNEQEPDFLDLRCMVSNFATPKPFPQHLNASVTQNGTDAHSLMSKAKVTDIGVIQILE